MSASNHINQKLFMMAKDLMNLHTADSRMNLPLSTNPSLRRSKIAESMLGPEYSTHGETAEEGEETLYQSIKKHGILEPVHVKVQDDGNMSLLQGHHRVATANFLNPSTIVPIKFVEGQQKESWEED